MDLLAALYFGIVISANVRAMHVTDNTLIRRETAYAGLGTGILLIVIYAVLGYVGVVSGSIASVNPATDTGATVLAISRPRCSARSAWYFWASCSSSPV